MLPSDGTETDTGEAVDASSEVSAPLIAGLALAAAGLLYWWAS